MTCLFISWVCDTCNPPAGQEKENTNKLYYGYVPFSMDFDIELHFKNEWDINVHVFKTEEDAMAVAAAFNIVNFFVKKVSSTKKIKYSPPKDWYQVEVTNFIVPQETEQNDSERNYVIIVD